MKSSKIQWLHRMGIDVWQPRTVEHISPDSTPSEPSQEIDSSSIQTSREKEASETNQSNDTKPHISYSTKTNTSKSKQESGTGHMVQIKVGCSSAAGLLLINDSEAIDRDFSEDIFRAYRLLKKVDSVESEASFFRFSWPEATRLSNVKGGNDTSLVGARRAFLAAARTTGKKRPEFVIAIGQQAIQLTNGENFDGVNTLQCLDEPDPRAFKMKIWAFLRDEQ